MKRIEAVFFQVGNDDRYPRMARVLDYTARLHCPGHIVSVRRITPAVTANPAHARKQRSFSTNSDKLYQWAAVVEAAAEGDCIALLDGDMMVVGDIDPVWSIPFDYAITDQRPIRMPFNGGAVYVRVNDRSRAFIRRWAEVNQEMYLNSILHQKWRHKYGGMNQAALGYMLEAEHWTPTRLPCAQWNNCDVPHWGQWRALDSRVIHIKSGLRRAVFAPGTQIFPEVVLLWRQYERDALALIGAA